ncbi:hypothetical protein JTB14_003358 [Gonioctena quinquepunctata]|nr:hypothetical protein JTB14_003358 [Gonioctena quinquepunctata]
MKGVVIHMDDVLVFAESVEEHDTILREVLQRLHAEGVTLNKGKCVIGANCVQYLGHILSDTGISINPQRVEAITKFPRPTSKTEILRFLGMFNFASLIPTKALDDLTPRLQRFRMRLMTYKYNVIYTPGKDLAMADALSRAPIEDSAPKQDELMLETDAHVRTIIETLPINEVQPIDNPVEDETNHPVESEPQTEPPPSGTPVRVQVSSGTPVRVQVQDNKVSMGRPVRTKVKPKRSEDYV